MSRIVARFIVVIGLSAQLFAAAPSTTSLDGLLDLVAKQVTGYLDKVSDVRCTENVRQSKLDKHGHIEFAEDAVYDYFVLLQGSDDELLLSESRIAKHEPKERKNMPMLISNGFSMLYLVFHPYYRNSFTFSQAGTESLDGRLYETIRFTHVPGNRTPAAVAVRGREFPLSLSGTAWIDTSTGKIARIAASLGNDMQDVGLRSLHAEIDFAPVSLPGWNDVYLFPSMATLDVETLRQHWRNTHRFSDYRRFLVETQQTVSDKELKSSE